MVACNGDVSRLLFGYGLTDSGSYEALGRLCDTVGPRLPGTAGAQAAERWAADEFRALGLRPRFQSLEVSAWLRGDCEVQCISPPLRRPLTAVAHGFAPEQCDMTARVLSVGYGLPADYERLGRAVRGKLVLVAHGAPEGARVPHRSEKFAWAERAGAAGMLLASAVQGRQPQTGVCADRTAPIPSVGIASEDAATLARLLEAGRRVTVRVRMSNTVAPARVSNVLADLPGRELPDEVVVVGAHLDSWDIADGALDNGSGCAVVLGVARALAALGSPPRRTVRFALWAAEEIGLLGSSYYVRRARRGLAKHVAYLNFDMPGTPNRLLLAGRHGEEDKLAPLARTLVGLGVGPAISTGICLSTDLRPFLLAGIPVLGVLGIHEGALGSCYHTQSDTFDKVDPAAILRAQTAAAVLAYAVADAERAPFARHTADEVRTALAREGVLATVNEDDITAP